MGHKSPCSIYNGEREFTGIFAAEGGHSDGLNATDAGASTNP